MPIVCITNLSPDSVRAANAAAALLVAGAVPTLPEGVERAAGAIDSGAARRLLERWSRLA